MNLPSTARIIDPVLPKCVPTHCLTNYYETEEGLPWHRDIYENDGDGHFSNLSIGAPAVFGSKNIKDTFRVAKRLPWFLKNNE